MPSYIYQKAKSKARIRRGLRTASGARNAQKSRLITITISTFYGTAVPLKSAGISLDFKP